MHLRCVVAESVNSNDNDQWWATNRDMLIKIKLFVAKNLHNILVNLFFSLLLNSLPKRRTSFKRILKIAVDTVYYSF